MEGRTGTVVLVWSDPQGVDNLLPYCHHRSFGALPLRPTATMRRTSHEVLLCASVYYVAGITAFDGWICRVDVIRVGADLRVRPQNRLRSGEDRRTHRSAPTVGAPTPPSGPLKRSRPSLRNEKKLRFLLAYELRKQRVTRRVTRVD